MPASTGSPINTRVKKIDGLSVRCAESEPRDVSAILLSPWPESLYTFERMWSRLAGEARRVGACTDFLPPGPSRSPRCHQGRSEDRAMGDFLVIIGIVVFVAAMLGLIWGLERI